MWHPNFDVNKGNNCFVNNVFSYWFVLYRVLLLEVIPLQEDCQEFTLTIFDRIKFYHDLQLSNGKYLRFKEVSYKEREL